MLKSAMLGAAHSASLPARLRLRPAALPSAVVRHAATVSGACLHSPASFLHPTSTHPWIHRPHIPAYPWAMQEVMHVPVVATLTLTLTLTLTRRSAAGAGRPSAARRAARFACTGPACKDRARPFKWLLSGSGLYRAFPDGLDLPEPYVSLILSHALLLRRLKEAPLLAL